MIVVTVRRPILLLLHLGLGTQAQKLRLKVRASVLAVGLDSSVEEAGRGERVSLLDGSHDDVGATLKQSELSCRVCCLLPGPSLTLSYISLLAVWGPNGTSGETAKVALMLPRMYQDRADSPLFAHVILGYPSRSFKWNLTAHAQTKGG